MVLLRLYCPATSLLLVEGVEVLENYCGRGSYPFSDDLLNYLVLTLLNILPILIIQLHSVLGIKPLSVPEFLACVR
jgi:hypothetical protein